jgi:hypothetical protein
VTDVVFGHRERDHNTGGVGTVGSVRKEGKSFTTVRSGEGAGGLSWKPFGLRDVGEAGCKDKRKAET